MNNFLEENKTLMIITTVLVILVSLFFLIKSIFFYSPSGKEKIIIRPAEDTGLPLELH